MRRSDDIFMNMPRSEYTPYELLTIENYISNPKDFIFQNEFKEFVRTHKERLERYEKKTRVYWCC